MTDNSESLNKYRQVLTPNNCVAPVIQSYRPNSKHLSYDKIKTYNANADDDKILKNHCEIKTKIIRQYIYISSRDRKRDENDNYLETQGSFAVSIGGYAPQYTVQKVKIEKAYSGTTGQERYIPSADKLATASLNDVITNVETIELKDCIIKSFNHPYLILRIPELPNVCYGTNNSLRNCFALLLPYITIADTTRCHPLVANDNNKKVFSPPIGRLQKLTMQLLKPDGEEYTFADADDEVLFILEVSLRVPDKEYVLGKGFN